MAWRDDLRVASFRGAQFRVETASIGVGRRLARHEYPQRDLPYLEDMGRKAREYKVEAFVVGDDYMLQRDELLAAIEEAGSGQLVHPYHGTLVVTVADCQITESTAHGGLAKFSINFVEAGKPVEPEFSEDSEAALDERAAIAEDDFAADFAETFSVDGFSDFVVDDALAGVQSVLDLPAMASAMGDLSWVRADALSPLRALLPENLLGSLADPISLARGLLALVSRTGMAAIELLDFSLPAVSSRVVTPSRTAQNTNRAALNDLLYQSAAMHRVGYLGRTVPPTYDDAAMARTEIVARTDRVLFSETAGARSVDAMTQLRTIALNSLSRFVPSLPRTVRVSPVVSRPAIVEAHDFYGDDWYLTGRDRQIIGRNRVRHPGAVAAGQPLEFIA